MLRGARYQQLLDSRSPLTQALLRNYEEWAQAPDCPAGSGADYGDQPGTAPFWCRRSSILFDMVAVYLGYEESLLNIESLPIALDDDGLTRLPLERRSCAWPPPGGTATSSNSTW
jgi:hypothetical protein